MASCAERPNGTMRSLSPLPRTIRYPEIEFQVLQLYSDDFSNPKCPRIKDLEHRPVTQTQGGVCRDIQHGIQFVMGQRFRQHLPLLGRDNIQRGVMLDHFIEQQDICRDGER